MCFYFVHTTCDACHIDQTVGKYGSAFTTIINHPDRFYTQFLETAVAKSRFSAALTAKRSWRVMPGLRGTFNGANN